MKEEYKLRITIMKKEYKLRLEKEDVYCYGNTREEAFQDLKSIYKINKTSKDLIRIPFMSLDEFIKKDAEENLK